MFCPPQELFFDLREALSTVGVRSCTRHASFSLPSPSSTMGKSSSSTTIMADAPAKQQTAAPAAKKDPKLDAIKAALASIKKQYGDGAIMEMGDTHATTIETFPSGSLSLDGALGGGFPRGRIIEIYGPESSGKTTLALHAIAEVQKKGGRAAFRVAANELRCLKLHKIFLSERFSKCFYNGRLHFKNLF